MPRDRNGEFETELVDKYQRIEGRLKRDICMMYLSGCSTRAVELMSEALIGRRVSRGEVSAISQELLTGIDKWRNRDLSSLDIKYMYVDGVFFKMRVEHKIERIPMLIVIGVGATQDTLRAWLTTRSPLVSERDYGVIRVLEFAPPRDR